MASATCAPVIYALLRMKLGAAESITSEVHARLAALALACLRPGRWYCLTDEETAPAIRRMHGRARFVPSVDAAHPRAKGPRPWLVMAYSPREGSPVALTRPGSGSAQDGPVIGSHVGRHTTDEARTCRLIRPDTRLTLGASVPLPVTQLCPECYSCTEPDFGRLRSALRRWQLENRAGGTS